MSTKANLSIDQGTTYSVTLTLTDTNGDPMNLSNYTASSKIKKWYTSSNSIAFNASINTATGSITLELDANTTATIRPGRYVYDVDITDGTSITRVVEGLAYVTAGVTNV